MEASFATIAKREEREGEERKKKHDGDRFGV